MSTIRARAQVENGVATVRALINHPMDVPDEDEGMPEGHFIQEVVAEHNGNKVLHAHWSPGISRNPYLSFKFDGEAGDTLKISWTDNEGESDSTEVELS